ncbi:MAG TPA: hypothetical protein VHO84_13080 [Syntrophorhabdaceae bacterium]|nr:hypothetical protein [Syntrophorhabdaceae bacterium]
MMKTKYTLARYQINVKEGEKELSHIALVKNIRTKTGQICILFIAVVLFVSLTISVTPVFSAEKKVQQKTPPKANPKTAPVGKEIIVNDANLMTHQKRVEDLVSKGDFNEALKIMAKINEYTREVLPTVKNIRAQYEKAENDQRVSQKDKEELFIKMRALDQLITRYSNYNEASTFNLGYMYSKMGETEKARKYLTEYLQMTPYSGSRDSQWMKAKSLLLELYKLEGEF